MINEVTIVQTEKNGGMNEDNFDKGRSGTGLC